MRRKVEEMRKVPMWRLAIFVIMVGPAARVDDAEKVLLACAGGKANTAGTSQTAAPAKVERRRTAMSAWRQEANRERGRRRNINWCHEEVPRGVVEVMMGKMKKAKEGDA